MSKAMDSCLIGGSSIKPPIEADDSCQKEGIMSKNESNQYGLLSRFSLEGEMEC
jgi:hypothetical protein